MELPSAVVAENNFPVAQPKPVSVAVCIATYKRPAGLKKLLESLSKLTFQNCPIPALRVIVVDNDPGGSAARTCEEARSAFPYPLTYCREQRRGISYTRNRAVECAGGGLDFYAFIDDDEVAELTWLDELLQAQQQYRADVICGPVISTFMEPVPHWIVQGHFFDRIRRRSGSSLELFNTGNVLIGAHVIAHFSPPFDERFSLTGGEDTHLALRVKRAGFAMIWADRAIVYEFIPKARATTNWILRRAYRLGNSYAVGMLDLDNSTLPRLDRLLKGAGRVLLGLVMLPLSVLGGQVAVVRALQMISRGAGTISGVIGYRYLEYSDCTP
jgi:succinoglycan biosynthesis protein ExoM